MLFSLVANDGLRAETNEDAREEGAELSGDMDRSGVAKPELRGVLVKGEFTWEPGPCRL